MPRRRRSNAEEPISAGRILEEALLLVDEQGFAALTLRRLTARLGIDPMAVYYYIPTKKDLVQRLVESVFSTMPRPQPSGHWRSRVHAWAKAYRTVALAHPNLVLQMLTNLDAVETAIRANQELNAALIAGGLPEDAASEGAGVLVDFLHGYLLGQTQAAGPAKTGETYFRFGLDVILDGLQARH